MLLNLLIVTAVMGLVSAQTASSRIKKVVILMLENRSFDHMLGFLRTLNSNINGCLPNLPGCSNKLYPDDPDAPVYPVGQEATNVIVDPSHSISASTTQIFGTDTTEQTKETMSGFVMSYSGPDAENDEEPAGAGIMQCFATDHAPILTTLAMEYGVFDGWFAAVPGPTMVNRAYAFSATSDGMGTNDLMKEARGLPQKTMFKQLREMGLDFRSYFSDVPTTIEMKDMRSGDSLQRFHFIDELYSDILAGDLPELSWVEPAYFNGPNGHHASDQHPNHDVSLGEQLIKDVYEALRASPLWNETALIISYDEHGGFFDHVAPPMNVPNPDGLNASDAGGFDFTRLGVRVPCVVVSPWVAKGSVWHAAEAKEYDAKTPGVGAFEHSSFASTIVHKLFSPVEGMPAPEYLTKRDQWAATFEHVFESLDAPREDSDCISVLPSVWSPSENLPSAPVLILDGSQPMSDLQQELVVMVAGAAKDVEMFKEGDEDGSKATATWNEGEGYSYVVRKMKELLRSAASQQ